MVCVVLGGSFVFASRAVTRSRNSLMLLVTSFIGVGIGFMAFSDRVTSYGNLNCQVSRKGYKTKAELLQLNRTQFSSLGIFISKKVGNCKN